MVHLETHISQTIFIVIRLLWFTSSKRESILCSRDLISNFNWWVAKFFALPLKKIITSLKKQKIVRLAGNQCKSVIIGSILGTNLISSDLHTELNSRFWHENSRASGTLLQSYLGITYAWFKTQMLVKILKRKK